MKMKDLRNELNYRLGLYNNRERKYRRANDSAKLADLRNEYKYVLLLCNVINKRQFLQANLYYVVAKSATFDDVLVNLQKYLNRKYKLNNEE